MSTIYNEVIIHPLVLLSTVDHYFRIAKDTSKRVCGILLGEIYKGKVDITNSYAIPFEEDINNNEIYFFDHIYHENMYEMFKKVNAKEKVVGWYSTGPKIKSSDIEINEIVKNYCTNPVLVIIDANPTNDLTIPTEAYYSVENLAEANKEDRRTFKHIPSSIGALEAEEIGVEHLLRDIRNTNTTTLTRQVGSKLLALKQLVNKIEEMRAYLDRVVKGELPANLHILGHMQDMFNLIPNLKVVELVKSFAVKTNDQSLVIYLSALIRAIVSLHNLIGNKIENRQDEIKKISDAQEEKLKKNEKKPEVVTKA